MRRWQLALSSFSLAKARLSLGNSLDERSLRGKKPSPSKECVLWARAVYIPAKMIIAPYGS